MAKCKKQTLWVMLNEREIHKVYECTKYNGYTEVEDCTLPKPYNPLRYIIKNSQIVDDPIKLKAEIARLTERYQTVNKALENCCKRISHIICHNSEITEREEIIERLTEENESLRKQLTDGKCVYLSDSETAEGCVQSPCPNYKTVEDILKENAELTARLATAVELPVKVGDTIYEILVSVHREWIVKEIKICEIWTKIDAQEKSSGAHWRFDLKDYNETWFTDPDRAKAEAELKGGEGE